MRTKQAGLIFIMALGAVTLRSQPTEDPSSNPDPASPPPAPYYPPGYAPPYASGYGGSRSGPSLMTAVTLPYAFSWNAAGISAEAGCLSMGQNFFGGEISYYGGSPQRYDVYKGDTHEGHFRSEQDITTIDFAYRYFEPLERSGPYARIAFYAGVSAGIGYVNYSNDGSAFGFHNDYNPDFSGDMLAGLQFSVNPGVAFRVGYRFIFISDAWSFNQRADLDSSAIEASIAFRF